VQSADILSLGVSGRTYAFTDDATERSRYQKLLGYKPVVDFEEGLKRTVAWPKQKLRTK
jgi:nucleoside-diphosphate-sugar epimerase